MQAELMRIKDVSEQGRMPCSTMNMSRKMADVMSALSESDAEGMTTREIAYKCDISVYAARNWLMKLEHEGHIYKIQRSRNSTWHLC